MHPFSPGDAPATLEGGRNPPVRPERIAAITLRRACESATRRVGGGARGEAAADDLARLAARVAGILEGRRDTRASAPTANPALIETLRTAVLQVWREDPSLLEVSEAAALLGAVDRVRDEMLARDRAREPAGNPRRRLPENLDLIVELAHDLRSPLTSILFLTDALRGEKSGEINALQRQQLGIIYSAALGLVSMAGDVIEYARDGHSMPSSGPAPFSISQLLDSVRDLVQPMTEARGIALRISAPEHDQLVGYPTPLSRVLLNLTANAVKATEKGYVLVAVRPLEEHRIEFSVTDTGSGLDPEAEKNLFEPFRTGPEGERIGFSGIGLGLDICRRLVAAMGGTLQYETVQGAGTRFWFELEMG